MVMRKSLDVVFSRFTPSIRNGGAYGFVFPRINNPRSPVSFETMCQVMVS